MSRWENSVMNTGCDTAWELLKVSLLLEKNKMPEWCLWKLIYSVVSVGSNMIFFLSFDNTVSRSVFGIQ